jgi:hypothetical protein
MDRAKRALRWLAGHAHANVVLPALVAAGLLAYIASLASALKNAAAPRAAIERVWWIVLLLTFPHLAARLYAWYDLMREMGIEVPCREALRGELRGADRGAVAGQRDAAAGPAAIPAGLRVYGANHRLVGTVESANGDGIRVNGRTLLREDANARDETAG